jgi:cyanophycinase-like exopeptidase
MLQSSIFRWQAGSGLLVLGTISDPIDSDASDIIMEILTRTVSDNPLAYIWTAGDIEVADHLLNEFNALGGRTSYLVDIVTEDDETIDELLSDAGIIILGDGRNIQNLRSSIEGVVLEAIQTAYTNGATIVGLGNAAGVLGEWMFMDGESESGFSWIRNALIVSAHDMVQNSQLEQIIPDFMVQHPEAFTLVLNAGAAIALLPNSTVELWGNRQVKIMLGSA